MSYHAIISEMIIKPEKEPIFSELATVVELAVEAAGPFVNVSQNSRDGGGSVSIYASEWPFLRDAIDRMFLIAEDLNHD